MSVWTALFVVGVVGLATYAMRAGLILTLADRELPPLIARALRNVAPAVLSALVVTLVADPDAANRGVSLAEVVGLAVVVPVAWRTRNLAVTLAAAMAAFWVVLGLG